jgi:stearoyl-CoA desaturase (delta-9 desaturase)
LIPIVSIHLFALAALIPWCFSWTGVGLMLLGTHFFGNWGINIGYHRLLAHRSFRTYRWCERMFTVIALCCVQDTPARWVATHRIHHCHADDPADPHSPLDDFGWAHVGWLFRRDPSVHDIGVLEKHARDVLRDPFNLWLEKHLSVPAWIYLCHAAIFFLVGLFLGRIVWSSWAAAGQWGLSLVVWGVILRTVTVWHITWSVNSFTHVFGYRTYTTGENSRNNWVVALLAAGEGWHNNHHWDPASATVQHHWWEVDTTYWTILCFQRLGLAWDIVPPRLQRASAAAKAPRP